MIPRHKNRIQRNRGAAIITAVIFFVVIATTMAVGLSSPVVREYVTARDFEKSKGAYYLSEAGMEDAVYRIRKNKAISAQEVISLGGNTATTTITTDSSIQKTIGSLGDILRNTRRVNSVLTTTTGESFIYGVWAGAGGVVLENSSSISGNLYSAGPVTGSGSNVISGTVISGGTTGLNGSITGVQNSAGASMYAGTITNATISGNAYCNTISGSSTTTCQTLTEQTASEFPITATDIANWETVATNGGTVPCTGGKYVIDEDTNFGPIKVPCDLEINGTADPGPTVTLQGPVWATGDITFKTKAITKVDPALIGQTIVMIADKPSDHINSSKIKVQGTGLNFYGAPGGSSWVMLISENTGASQGDLNEAIEFEQSATGKEVLLYSRLGDILLQQSSSVSEVTGYKITLQQTANVTYSMGLQNALFTSGPGGAWYVRDWKEGQ